MGILNGVQLWQKHEMDPLFSAESASEVEYHEYESLNKVICKNEVIL